MDNERWEFGRLAGHPAGAIGVSWMSSSAGISVSRHTRRREPFTLAPRHVITPFGGQGGHPAYAILKPSAQVTGLLTRPTTGSAPLATLAPEITLVSQDLRRYATNRSQKCTFRYMTNNRNPMNPAHPAPPGRVGRKGHTVSRQPQPTAAGPACPRSTSDPFWHSSRARHSARPPPGLS
jgi:hypothetical protein